MVMTSDGKYLTSLCFLGSCDMLKVESDGKEEILPVFADTIKWLDMYFGGELPDFTPKHKVLNITPFRSRVIDIMNKITDFTIFKSSKYPRTKQWRYLNRRFRTLLHGTRCQIENLDSGAITFSNGNLNDFLSDLSFVPYGKEWL